MQNRAYAPTQYRVLSYGIPELMRLAGIPVVAAYMILRTLCLMLAGIVFYRFCRRWMSATEALAPLFAVFVYYGASVLRHIQPAEEPNLLLFALCLTFIRDRRFAPLLVTFAVAAFNKETVGFLIPMYLLWEMVGARSPVKDSVPRTAALTLVLLSIYFGVRAYSGVDRPTWVGFGS